MRRLILVRHGESEFNALQILDTSSPGPGLSPLGFRQAEALPSRLNGESIDVVFASQMLRARQTAEPLAEARSVRVQTDVGLREMHAGTLSGRGDANAHAAAEECYSAWVRGDLTRRLGDGESAEQGIRRVNEAMERIAARTEDAVTVVAVSHRASIRLWAASVSENVSFRIAGQPLGNTEILTLERASSGWRLMSWEDLSIDEYRAAPCR